MSCCNASQQQMCPMRMNDGRAFTDYRPRCMTNAELMQRLDEQNMANSSYESRMFLQKNAESLMEKYKSDAEALVKCGPCTQKDTMLPERYVVRCDTVGCKRQEVNPDGLGDGRQY